MHTCPECGQACDCSGDIDDCEIMTKKWAWKNCTCCEGDNDLERDEDEDED